MKGTFSSLHPNAEIFKYIDQDKPLWWKLFREDPDLHVEIRKDNYLNIYYLGGSIAKVAFKKKEFVAEIHHKYLDQKNPHNKTYLPLDLASLDREKLSRIKLKIEGNLRERDYEHPSEKRIQGEMLLKNSNYIDSEFQYNQGSNNKKLRIDLVELNDKKLTFIELKGISDNRLRNDEKSNHKTPEIIEQMNTYKSFIETHKKDLLDYYTKLIKIKQNLRLLPVHDLEFKVNPIPKLIIVNTYKKSTSGREKRISAIIDLLTEACIDHEIINWKNQTK